MFFNQTTVEYGSFHNISGAEKLESCVSICVLSVHHTLSQSTKATEYMLKTIKFKFLESSEKSDIIGTVIFLSSKVSGAPLTHSTI